MAKITKHEEKNVIKAKTAQESDKARPGAWWNASTKKERCDQLIATATFLRDQNNARYRQASLYAALYGKMPHFGVAGANLVRIATKTPLPSDRPTMSVITSITDTIVSRLTQNKPRPLFLTENGNYKARTLAKQMNNFIAGEFFQTKAYEHGETALRDACVWGPGVLKVLETQDKRVGLERRLHTQLHYDWNEAFIGRPRQLYEMALVDRATLAASYPDAASKIMNAEQAFPDSTSGDDTVSDQLLVVEGWLLPSHPKANDGVHIMACSSGIICDEEYKKSYFPFPTLQYSKPLAGPWGQGVAERQLGNQNAINGILMTTHKSIRLVGVPRIFAEKGSKVVKAHFNNEIGTIIEYSGTKPEYSVAQCIPVEMYREVQNIIDRAYQEEGVNQLTAAGKKPAGLNSGEAQREYDDLQSDRFTTLQRAYENFYIELAYQIIDKAREIAERDGSYQTVFPDKDGTREINLPDAKRLDDPFAIQCFEESSLPRDPAGRTQTIIERMQAGIYTKEQGHRLLGSLDTAQEDKLLTAAEDRILKILDEIVEDGKFTPPDPFMDLEKATLLCTQYYNLYLAAGLEEKKAEMLRQFFAQVQNEKAKAQSAMMPPGAAPGMPGMPGPGGAPQATPEAPPVSPMLPNSPGGAT